MAAIKCQLLVQKRNKCKKHKKIGMLNMRYDAILNIRGYSSRSWSNIGSGKVTRETTVVIVEVVD